MSSTRSRVAFTAALIMAFVVLISLFAVLFLQRADAVTNLRLDRTLAARDVAVSVREGTDLPKRLPITGKALVQVVDAHRRVLSSGPRLAGRPALPVRWPERGTVTDTRVCRGDVREVASGRCLIAVAITAPNPRGESITIIAASPEPGLFPRSGVLLSYLLIALGFVATAGAGTWVAVARSLRPVEAIRAELARITDTDLRRRVPVPPGGARRDEIGRLALTVNATLDRLQDAVRSNQAFVADASHELRSPLTTLRSTTEVALLHPERVDTRRTLEAVLHDVDRLQSIVGDLLLLARLDSERPATGRHADLVSVVRQEIEHHEHRIPVELALTERAIVAADELALARVVVNLVDNAVRHATTLVRVAVRTSDDEAILEVTDDGPGVGPGDRERIFERFTRLDAGRARDSGGSGLGLAIARGIATAYGGTLTVDDGPEGGARFVLRLALS